MACRLLSWLYVQKLSVAELQALIQAAIGMLEEDVPNLVRKAVVVLGELTKGALAQHLPEGFALTAESVDKCKADTDVEFALSECAPAA